MLEHRTERTLSMPKEIGSNRIKRLNSIMEKLCSRTALPGKEIRETAESVSARTLQRDLCYLRNEFGADIDGCQDTCRVS